MKRLQGSVLGLAFLATAVAGCGNAADEDIGGVRLELAQAPSDVRCVRATFTGNRTVVASLDVTAGESTSTTVTSLPVSPVSVVGQAFNTACAEVGPASVATWVSDAVTTTPDALNPPTVTLVMRRNGRATATFDFQDDAPSVKTIYAMVSVGEGSRLVRFQSTAPGTLDANVLVTGLPDGERVIGMDFRPSTGELFGVGSDSQLYLIDPATGVVTPVGTPFSPALEPTPSQYIGAGFNPEVDGLRIWNATGQNLRLNPTTGAVAAVDSRLTDISTRAVAYTPAPGTVLYALDALNEVLVRSTNPNDGIFEVVGPLGIDMEAAGLDIDAAGNAFAALRPQGGDPNTTLYRVTLPAGTLTSVGVIALPTGVIKAIAIAP
jgi:hypothetical protein